MKIIKKLLVIILFILSIPAIISLSFLFITGIPIIYAFDKLDERERINEENSKVDEYNIAY